jgi:hypothetical protein
MSDYKMPFDKGCPYYQEEDYCDNYCGDRWYARKDCWYDRRDCWDDGKDCWDDRKDYWDDCKERRDDRKHQRDDDRQKIAFACGTGTGAILPISPNIVVGVAEAAAAGGINTVNCSIPLGTVSLDTRGIKKPTTKVDFSSIISVRTETRNYYIFDYFLRLTFRLSRVCDNGSKIPLGTWNFELTNDLEFNGNTWPENLSHRSNFTQSFNFSWCECQECPGCCTYIVEITDIHHFGIECASINNVSLNALAVGC